MAEYINSAANRNAAQRAGKVLVSHQKLGDAWQPENTRDIYETPPGGVRLGEYRAGILVAAHIMKGARGDTKDQAQRDLYDSRRATCEVLLYSQITALTTLNDGGDPVAFLESDIGDKVGAKRAAAKERRFSTGELAYRPEDLLAALKLVLTILQSSNVTLTES